MKDVPVVATSGQEPIKIKSLIWVIVLIVLWAANSVMVKIVVRDIPSFWAAFLRFSMAFPFLSLFIWWNRSGFQVTLVEFLKISMLSVFTVIQIATFNYGSQFTTGGRVALIIFSYPLIVPLVAPLFLKAEPLQKTKLLGCLLSFVGLAVAIRGGLRGGFSATLKGDLIELFSCLILSIAIVYNKRLALSIDKWKILFYDFLTAITLFGACAVIFETFDYQNVHTDAWSVLIFQGLAVSAFCFMSWQYLLARHNSTSLSVFFFASPIVGMFIGIFLLDEPFEASLLAGCLLVGVGVFIVNRTSLTAERQKIED